MARLKIVKKNLVIVNKKYFIILQILKLLKMDIIIIYIKYYCYLNLLLAITIMEKSINSNSLNNL